MIINALAEELADYALASKSRLAKVAFGVAAVFLLMSGLFSACLLAVPALVVDGRWWMVVGIVVALILSVCLTAIAVVVGVSAEAKARSDLDLQMIVGQKFSVKAVLCGLLLILVLIPAPVVIIAISFILLRAWWLGRSGGL